MAYEALMGRFRFEDDPLYSMPAHFGGMKRVTTTTTYRDVTSLIVQYRTERDAIEPYVPEAATATIAWRALTWQQAPTQAHITAALAAMPVLEVTAAFVTRGESILIGDKARALR
jgi:hypothetical protein